MNFNDFAINLFSNDLGQLCIVGHNLNRNHRIVKDCGPDIIGQKEFRFYNTPDTYAKKAENATASANNLAGEIRETKQTIAEVRHRLGRLKNLATACTIIVWFIGFAFGIWLGSAEILYFHGPTVTVIGTIIGSLFTFILCIGFSYGLAWMVRMEFDQHIANRKQILVGLKKHLSDLQNQQNRSIDYAKYATKKVFD